jgi:hypothetical protein
VALAALAGWPAVSAAAEVRQVVVNDVATLRQALRGHGAHHAGALAGALTRRTSTMAGR